MDSIFNAFVSFVKSIPKSNWECFCYTIVSIIMFLIPASICGWIILKIEDSIKIRRQQNG
jgi:ABC-type arginine transport system permease subunit